MQKYKISVIMAVYNVEPYIREAVDSVIAQDIGFENIQLILVDDGSPDGSPAICDQYAQQYPQNIEVIHKVNGGVSSARNAGLERVRGELVNFLDSDDMLTPSVARNAWNFYKKNREKTDVVVIPMHFFEGKTGEHTLNYKFNKGSRVIDLDKEWNVCQLQVGATFINAEALRKIRFEENLRYAEDAHLLQRVLANKCTMGVLKDGGKYMYRQRISGAESALQGATGKKAWYIPYLTYFQEGIIEYYRNRFGMVPKFIQFVLMYDLQWRIRMAQLPQGVLNEEEKAEFLARLYGILKYIDDDVIFAQRNIFIEHKVFALKKKYGRHSIQLRDQDIAIVAGTSLAAKISDCACNLEFLHFADRKCILEGRVGIFAGLQEDLAISVCVNDKEYPCALGEPEDYKYALGEPILYMRSFTAEIPLEPSEKQVSVDVYILKCGRKIRMEKLRSGTFFPVNNQNYDNSYAVLNGWKIAVKDGSLQLCRISGKKALRCELAWLKEMWVRNGQGERIAVLARIVLRILLWFKHRPLWLISDRASRASDNGEALFRYLREKQPQIRAYFVIARDCPDYVRMKAIGPVLIKDSFKHKLFLLMSDYICSSHAEADVYNPFIGYSEPYRDYLAKTRFVFLQHGITHNDLSDWLDRYKKNIYGFITAAKPEYDSIVNGKYHYTQKQVWYTGFPRFDRLYSDNDKRITIMPTWRRYLFGECSRETKVFPIGEKFMESEYLAFYNDLLNHPRLLEAAREYGYTIAFFPHPNVQDHIEVFRKNAQILYLGKETEYRDVYAKSDLVVTDYSSAVFDFAYLRKPILYAQFDKEMFYSGEHTLSKGYFDYEQDGFGEVTYTLEETVDVIIEYMRSGCSLKPEYRQRIDNFFAFRDQNSCQRVYEKIASMER